MNKIILYNTGVLLGFQKVPERMQDSYTQAIAMMVKAIGNNVIISGCVVSGGAIGNGVVVINSKIMPFVGGALKTGIAETASSQNESYHTGGPKPLYVDVYAIPDDAGEPLTNFVRLSTAKAHYAHKSNPHEVTKAQVGLGNLPNAKSDSISLDSSDNLATGKAAKEVVSHLLDNVITGSVYIGDPEPEGIDGTDNYWVITHNIGHTNYVVALSYSTGKLGAETDGETDILLRLSDRGTNTMTVHVHELDDSDIKDITLHYFILKLS
ncbi:MAG: hypothetical protein IPH58_05635 [Sphingobacteriales bacterium]|jgi:hypothetical protein|nr:hypothetical protein [Sphingobacteriales bacterium]